MGISVTTGHTNTSSTTRSLRKVPGNRSGAHTLTVLHSHRNNQQHHHGTIVGKPHRQKADQKQQVWWTMCQKQSTSCPLVFSVVFFWGAGGKGEYRSSPSSLICQHHVYMMTNKTRSNPDWVVVSLKNRKQTNQGYPTGILDHLRDTRSVPWRDPRPE